jgi:hypothetical protein
MLNLLLKQSRDSSGIKGASVEKQAPGVRAAGSKAAVQRAFLESSSANVRKLIKEDLQMLRTVMSGIKSVFAEPEAQQQAPERKQDVPAPVPPVTVSQSPAAEPSKVASPEAQVVSSPEALDVQQLAFATKLPKMRNEEVIIYLAKALLKNSVAFKMVFPNPDDRNKPVPALLVAIKDKLGLK